MAEKRAREILANLDRESLGLERNQRVLASLEELLAEYVVELTRRKRTVPHIKQVASGIARLATGAGISRVEDWDPRATERGLASLGDVGSRQRNKIRGFAKAFFRWMNRTRRFHQNPIEGVDPEPRESRWEERRALTPDELRRLAGAAPEPRALIYMVMATTGIRRREAGRLRQRDVFLGEGESRLVLPARITKSKKSATLPIPASVAERWRIWLSDPWVAHGPGRRACDAILPPVPRMETYRRDLDAAGIDAGNRRVDIHALRVTFITSLARAGVPFAKAVELARHSDPKLTAKIYTKFANPDLDLAARQLDSYLIDSACEEERRDTRGGDLAA